MWEYQMTALTERGYRCLGIDRRGSGRSTSGRAGFGLDQLADDLAGALDQLGVRGATLVAHSMGGPEAVRMLARHGSDRVAHLVLVASITPALVRSQDNPDGLPAIAYDEMVAGLRADKPAYLAAMAPGFFGGEEAVSPELIRWGVGLAARASLRSCIELTRTQTVADVRADVARIATPTLVLHGDADVAAPLELCGRRTAGGIAGSRLVVYPGGPHGLPLSAAYKERLTEDIAAVAADRQLPISED
jgi:pimeloyl-ACP methyl ester carboxylesterase